MALQRTAAPLGSRAVQVICQRLLQPTGRFRRRSLSLCVSQQHDAMSFLDRFRSPKRPGLRHSEEARQWARGHFPKSHQHIAAIVGGILCEQTGAQFSELNASTHFVYDMGVFDFFDAIDYVAAIQDEFGVVISENDAARIQRISELVQYLYDRVATTTG